MSYSNDGFNRTGYSFPNQVSNRFLNQHFNKPDYYSHNSHKSYNMTTRQSMEDNVWRYNFGDSETGFTLKNFLQAPSTVTLNLVNIEVD